MKINIRIAEKLDKGGSFAIITDDRKPLATPLLTTREKTYVSEVRAQDPKSHFIQIPRIGQCLAVAFLKHEDSVNDKAEACRRAGSRLADILAEHKVSSVTITTGNLPFGFLAAFAEGIALSAYRFLKYFSEENARQKDHLLSELNIVHRAPDLKLLGKVIAGAEYTIFARDIVNEPASAFSAQNLATLIAEKARNTGIKAEIFSKAKIEALKMGGLLAVNKGSVDPPAFTVLEYFPKNAVNTLPIVLVGKGIIFDTGGMNLKPGSFMDGMKSDMAGAAMMAAAIMAVASLKLPVNVVALLPSTDNRVDGNAMVPGDVITMHDGTRVEVNNTDAEGRLILADALSYAKRYNPALVIDAATLTGAAMRAIGHYGIVAMQNRAPEYMEQLKHAGEKTYERIAEFPMWKEYEELLKSDIADLSNIGGLNGGAITAAKFLAHFTDYPYIHLDIAGPALIDKREHYLHKGATGMGVRLLVDFIENIILY